MKNTKLFIIFIIVLVIILALVNVKWISKRSQTTQEPYEYHQETNPNNKYTQISPLITASGFTTRDNNNPDIKHVHYVVSVLINSSLSLDSSKSLKSVEIKNINYKYLGPGDIKIIAPSHIESNANTSYYLTLNSDIDPFSLKNGSNHMIFKLDPNAETPKYMDEIARYNAGILRFNILIVGVGAYNHADIMQKYGKVESSKLFEYARIDPNKLTGTIDFDIVYNLSDGTNETHHVKATIDGIDIAKYGHISAIDSLQTD